MARISGRGAARDAAGSPRPPAFSGAPDLSGLRPYQAAGVVWLRERASALLADEMRLGKSCQALRALEPPAMILCPASARHVWRDEIARWRPGTRVAVAAPGEIALPARGVAVAVSTYDALPELEERSRGRWLLPYNLSRVTLVMDEAHMVKNPRSARAARAALLARQCGRVWGLTGTPMAGRPPDLWGMLSALRLAREAFGTFERFAGLFGGRLRVLPPRRARLEEGAGVADGGAGGEDVTPKEGRPRRFWEWPDAPPSPQALAAFGRVALRRLRRDVAPEMPARTCRDVVLDDEPEIAAELDRVGWPEGADLPPLEGFSALRARVAEARIPALLERVAPFEETWSRTVPEDERLRVVVFSAHRAPVDALARREGWASITGSCSAERRRVACDLFRQGLVRGMACTIGAGAVAIDLSSADHAIFVDRSFTPADNAQAEDRLQRVGKKSPVCVERLVSSHPLDLRVQRVLDEKQARIAAAVRV